MLRRGASSVNLKLAETQHKHALKHGCYRAQLKTRHQNCPDGGLTAFKLHTCTGSSASPTSRPSTAISGAGASSGSETAGACFTIPISCNHTCVRKQSSSFKVQMRPCLGRGQCAGKAPHPAARNTSTSHSVQ